jgi:hypothetical protein
MMLKLNVKSFFPVTVLAACVAIAAPNPVRANCAGFVRPPEIVNPEVKQRAIQLKNDANQFLGQKLLDVIVLNGRSVCGGWSIGVGAV